MGVQFEPLSKDQQRMLYALLDIARIAVGTKTHPMVRAQPPAAPAPTPAPQQAPAAPDQAAKPATGQQPRLGDPDFFDPINEGYTGKVSISEEVTLAAAMRRINDNDFAGAKKELLAVFAADAHHPKARLCWLLAEARELKGVGRVEEAMGKYQQMLQLEETHAEAIAELRAHYAEQRQGLVGKLFGPK
jgi:hypothetical protein